MKLKLPALLAAVMIIAPLQNADAGSRYSTPPAAKLSQDLASPWLLQLQKNPVNSRAVTQKRRVYVAPKRHRPVVKRRTTVNRQLWQPAPRPVTARSARQNRQATGIFRQMHNPFARQQPQVRQRQPVLRSGVQTRQPQFRHPVTPKRTAFGYASQPKPKPRPAHPPLDPKYLPQMVTYVSDHKPGTIIVDANSRFLYLVTGPTEARRYGVGVGKAGFEWSGTHKITHKKEWPSWRPPQEMIVRERAKGRELPTFMEGGPKNPLGARALYIGDTLYRIHGTNQPWTIGQAVSSGCIRMRNEDVIDLYERAKVGAKVIVS